MTTDVELLAQRIAVKILPHNHDTQRRLELQALLLGFAAEIRRGAIEG